MDEHGVLVFLGGRIALISLKQPHVRVHSVIAGVLMLKCLLSKSEGLN